MSQLAVEPLLWSALYVAGLGLLGTVGGAYFAYRANRRASVAQREAARIQAEGAWSPAGSQQLAGSRLVDRALIPPYVAAGHAAAKGRDDAKFRELHAQIRLKLRADTREYLDRLDLPAAFADPAQVREIIDRLHEDARRPGGAT